MKLNIRKEALQRKKIMKSIISSIGWILNKALDTVKYTQPVFY